MTVFSGPFFRQNDLLAGLAILAPVFDLHDSKVSFLRAIKVVTVSMCLFRLLIQAKRSIAGLAIHSGHSRRCVFSCLHGTG